MFSVNINVLERRKADSDDSSFHNEMCYGVNFANQKEVNAIVEEEEDNWMTPIIRCLAEGIWPEDKDEKRALRLKTNQYVLEGGVLFKKGYLIPMLRCMGPLQANYVIREIHMRSCGIHIEARSVVAKDIRQGYYWPTMHRDARNVTHAKFTPRCRDAQKP
ncbi:hypothetical protein Tco_0771894 [Tanacetum coccineum]|uniref:Integrase zinc-binding domain-containing protein n=1 Tax=Tanacetum coccineum TaxID=301880 RepID=A0ABQ4ZKE8_9ASTR